MPWTIMNFKDAGVSGNFFMYAFLLKTRKREMQTFLLDYRDPCGDWTGNIVQIVQKDSFTSWVKVQGTIWEQYSNEIR